VPFAAVTLKFGEEGTGAGFFQDARHVAVDEAGNIYVGEYSGGRIQAFDPSGNFVTQWIPGPDIYLTGMAASRDGIVYAVYGGKIYRYQGLTGTLLGQVEYAPGTYFSTIDIAADNGLVLTMSSAGEDDVFFFDSQGTFKSKIENPVTEAPGAPFDASADQISTDGLGNLYAVTSGSEPSVYKFNAQGQFIGRFTGPTDEVNGVEFVSPADVAVDSQSRIFISDPFSGIIVLDPNGNYIRTIDVDSSGALSGIVFDYAGNLWVVARTQVLKLAVNK
jgi:sugar lactone lactonase YvrE